MVVCLSGVEGGGVREDEGGGGGLEEGGGGRSRKGGGGALEEGEGGGARGGRTLEGGVFFRFFPLTPDIFIYVYIIYFSEENGIKIFT